VVDIHSHIIPYIDDGAKSLDVAIAMLKKAEESGTEKIILTPHYLNGKSDKTILEVKALTEKIKEIAQRQNIKIEIYYGQEILYTNSLIKNFLEGKIGTLNNTRYMLIEFLEESIDKKVISDLCELKLRGIVPIIAHPERHKDFIDNPSYINEFAQAGALFQLDACSIENVFGDNARKTAEVFLRNKIYSFIGSDAHNTRSRTTDISRYKSKIERVNLKFINDSNKNGKKLLNNEEVKFKGKKIEQKSNFSFSLFIS
jgi:protein-tyrosine phosphatase